MKVVIYSTSSSAGMLEWMSNYTSIPSITDQWKSILDRYPEHSFTVVAVKECATHLLDFDSNLNEIVPEGVKVILLPLNTDADTYVDTIKKEKPEMAIAASYVGGIMDWDTIQDAIIAEELEKDGVKTVSHSLYAATTFFDKWNTHRVLKEKGFNVAKAVHIPSLYMTLSKDHPDVRSNVYLDLVFHKIRQMDYPLIIKSSAGSGSNGIDIVDSYEEAKKVILGREEPVDIIVEEMISGEQFGTEIHGTPGNYTVLPPFKFSLNEKGITDPMHNAKFGPVTDEKYRIEELRSMLKRLATEMELAVSAQVDLAFDGEKWYIIEVNPRISGMSISTSACEGRTPLEVVIESGLEKINFDIPKILEKCFNFRIYCMDKAQFNEFCREPSVKYVEYSDMSQYKEGLVMANIVLSGFGEFSDLTGFLSELRKRYPAVISEELTKMCFS